MIITREPFFEAVRHRFGKLTPAQVAGYERLLSGLESETDLPLTHAAYLLATTRHETAETMEPILERGSRDYIAARYDPFLANSAKRRSMARALGNVHPGDGWKYRGRGYVQLTSAANYERMGALVKVDLVNHPDLALDADIAYRILSLGLTLGLFTGARLSDFLTAHATDYRNARRCVNGMDRADIVAAYATLYERCLRAST